MRVSDWPFLTWSPDDAAAAVYDVTVDGAWEQLAEFYAGETPSACATSPKSEGLKRGSEAP